jgi:hypothetical protein
MDSAKGFLPKGLVAILGSPRAVALKIEAQRGRKGGTYFSGWFNCLFSTG